MMDQQLCEQTVPLTVQGKVQEAQPCNCKAAEPEEQLPFATLQILILQIAAVRSDANPPHRNKH